VPVRSSIAGAAIAIAAMSAALTFGASLDHLLGTPRLYGWNWDGDVFHQFGGEIGDEVLPTLGADERLTEIAMGTFPQDVEMGADGLRVQVLGFQPVRGSIGPTVLEGRAAVDDDEVALGVKTMRALHTGIGDTVEVASGDRHVPMQVVGTVVLPGIGDSIGLGHGAAFSVDGLRRIAPSTARVVAIVRAGGRTGDIGRLLTDATSSLPIRLGVTTDERPTDIVNFGGVQGLPRVFAGLLALLATGTLVHTLVTSVRRRRRELAVLKTLGFRRGQVSRALAWEATTVTLLALLMGVPIGTVVGRSAWLVFAGQLGVARETRVPFLALLLLVPAALLVANVAAAVPGGVAGRTKIADAFRTE
jgi:hypothetical protein